MTDQQEALQSAFQAFEMAARAGEVSTEPESAYSCGWRAAMVWATYHLEGVVFDAKSPPKGGANG